MDWSSEYILLIGSVLLFLSIIASKTSFRLGIPSLVLFIFIGMLAGSDGIGGIYFDDPQLAQVLGVIALNFILFAGGMETSFSQIRPVLWRGISLSTIGVLFTAAIIGYFTSLLTELNLIEGFLLGAIVSSTDAAAVFSILKTRKVRLATSLEPTLELESGSNDPMAYFLTIALIQIIQTSELNALQLVGSFMLEMGIGAIAGVCMGFAIVWIINKIHLEVSGLYSVLLLALLFFTYSATHLIHGNGFLAVYIAGVVLGSKDFVQKKQLIRFYDGQAWLMQIVMFLTLGLLVFPKQLIPLIGPGLSLSAILIFVARPIGVFVSLGFFKMRLNQLVFISWVGLRGAVPIVFATYPLLARLEHAQFIFNVVFFISLTSVLLQGTSLPFVARILGVIEKGEGNASAK
jgi:potassium/hydrogen antiporter